MNKNIQSNTKKSPVVAKVIFTDGNTRYFSGNFYEKEDINIMVYNLRKMLLTFFHNKKINAAQIFDNTLIDNRIIFEYKHDTVLTNNLASYLGQNYNPKTL